VPLDACASGSFDGYFLASVSEFPPNEFFERAPEYGERVWRIRGRKYSIIAWDAGNGWFDPLGVEIEVENFKYVRR